MNRYSIWKTLGVLALLILGTLYASPNLYAPDSAVQVTGERSSTKITYVEQKKIEDALKNEAIEYKSAGFEKNLFLIRLKNAKDQLRAQKVVRDALDDKFIVALNLADTTPNWLASLGGKPMKLGLDLKGGVHFLLEVDMPKAIQQKLEITASELRSSLRTEKLRFRRVFVEGQNIKIQFADAEFANRAESFLRKEQTEYSFSLSDVDLIMKLTDQAVSNIETYAIEQNLTTLRNRINALGVAEPLIQRQGKNRIVVELPGVQDTAAAKRVLGATANLEFRLAAPYGQNDPLSTETFAFRDNPNRSAVMLRDIITTGNNVSNAGVGTDENGNPQVNIRLNGQGGRLMSAATRHNVGKQMGVLFIEHKTRNVKTQVDGKEVEKRIPYTEKSLISVATIQSELGASFRITGVGSFTDASELALLLKAGALAAPIYFVEERTIGPSLGEKNIAQGILSMEIGMILVVIFMFILYRIFGLFANISLFFNLVLLVSLMSILGATLTMPGIAGIVLTLGMAVDANVLINSRIKEEFLRGLTLAKSVDAGFDRAFTTILDANLTTLLVAIILFSIGTGPVKGFAVTLSIGILTSMFSAILVTRMQVNWYLARRKKLSKLPF